MKKTILISALVATGLSTAAFAQEAGTPSPMARMPPPRRPTPPRRAPPPHRARPPRSRDPGCHQAGHDLADATTSSPTVTTPDTVSALLMDQQAAGSDCLPS